MRNDDILEEAVSHTVQDMLIEAAPRKYLDHEVNIREATFVVNNPVQLLNLAWKIYNNNLGGFSAWESKYVESPNIDFHDDL